MLAILLRNPFVVAGGRRSPATFLRLLHHESISKPFSTSPSPPNSDLAVSFFETSCGLSPSAALSAASKINMKTTANAESLLRLLETYGFTKPSIALIAAKQPSLFCFHPEKCIKPKLDLFIAAGFTQNFIVKIFSKSPSTLKSSLENRLSPNLHLLITILGGDIKAAAMAIASSTWILIHDLTKFMLPNIETLREHGVAGVNIARLIAWCPRTITTEPDKFSKHVALIEGMGFDPSKTLFILGIKVVAGMNRTTWERKLRLYNSLGWSEKETISAFKKYPLCMLLSEDKVRKNMAFFVDNLKWEPSRLVLRPIFLCLSFEKRILPRYAVFNILSASGLSGSNLCFQSFLFIDENSFLKKYVWKYSDTVPKLLEAYKVKLDMAVTIPSSYVL